MSTMLIGAGGRSARFGLWAAAVVTAALGCGGSAATSGSGGAGGAHSGGGGGAGGMTSTGAAGATGGSSSGAGGMIPIGGTTGVYGCTPGDPTNGDTLCRSTLSSNTALCTSPQPGFGVCGDH